MELEDWFDFKQFGKELFYAANAPAQETIASAFYSLFHTDFKP
jgi:hypothetical protein